MSAPDVQIACEAVGDLNADAIAELPYAVECWRMLCEAKRTLSAVIEDVENGIASRMEDKRLTVDGCTVERHRKAPRRTNWDHDGVLRLVVDSRSRDEATGEIESTLDVVKKVYPLKGYNARLGALKALGIDVDEFCETEWADRWTLREFSADARELR